MFNIGKLYKFFLDIARSSETLTYLIFGVKVWRKKLETNWDVTTLVLKKAIDKHIEDNHKKVLDMGCGHIALLTQYIKKNNKTNKVIGVDVYADFIRNAVFNAHKNSNDIIFRKSNLYKNINGKFDYIAFNPPYVPTKISGAKYQKASFSGNDGLYTIRKFLLQSKSHLNVSGVVLLGVNCFHVRLENILGAIKDNDYKVKDIVTRRFNTARAFILRLK